MMKEFVGLTDTPKGVRTPFLQPLNSSAHLIMNTIKKEVPFSEHLFTFGSPGRTRTCNLLVNSQPLLPIELPGNIHYLIHYKPERHS